MMMSKTTMIVILYLQTSHLLTFSLPTEEVFRVNCQNRPVANLPTVDFQSFPAEGNGNTKATKFVTFGFPFCILVFFLFQKTFNLTVDERYNFFSVLAAIIRQTSDKLFVMRIERVCVSFINLTEWRQRRVTCQQLIDYINTGEKIRYFFTCVVKAFLRAGNPCITPQFM